MTVRNCLLAFLMFPVVVAAASSNLLDNPCFEHEGLWGSSGAASLRNKWRSHDETGVYTAALLGGWASRGDQGLIEQEYIPVQPGEEYAFRLWVWIDFGWHTTDQYIGVRYFDRDGEELAAYKELFSAELKTWTRLALVSTAPANAVSATVQIYAENISNLGSVAVDDTFFGLLEGR